MNLIDHKRLLIIFALSFLSLPLAIGQCMLDSIFINALLIDPSGGDIYIDTNQDGLVNSNDEFVEICNSGMNPVDLSFWQIGDDDPLPFPDFEFPDNTFLEGGQCLLLVTNFCPGTPIDSCDAPTGIVNMGLEISGFLGNNGDVITLVNPSGNSCTVVYGGVLCSDVDTLDIPSFNTDFCNDWGGDVDGCALMVVGDSCEYIPAVLASEFLEFQASVEDIDKVVLTWIVQSDGSAEKYIVEWSDGNAQEFFPITTVNARSVPEINEHYSFVHINASSGLNYYRIKSVDVVGNVSVSKTIPIFIDKEAGIKIAPSVTSQYFVLKGNANSYALKIFSTTGTLMLSKENVTIHDQLDISHLNSGFYIINLSRKGHVESFPIIKI